jgi:hypothetical protein
VLNVAGGSEAGGSEAVGSEAVGSEARPAGTAAVPAENPKPRPAQAILRGRRPRQNAELTPHPARPAYSVMISNRPIHKPPNT